MEKQSTKKISNSPSNKNQLESQMFKTPSKTAISSRQKFRSRSRSRSNSIDQYSNASIEKKKQLIISNNQNESNSKKSVLRSSQIKKNSDDIQQSQKKSSIPSQNQEKEKGSQESQRKPRKESKSNTNSRKSSFSNSPNQGKGTKAKKQKKNSKQKIQEQKFEDVLEEEIFGDSSSAISQIQSENGDQSINGSNNIPMTRERERKLSQLSELSDIAPSQQQQQQQLSAQQIQKNQKIQDKKRGTTLNKKMEEEEEEKKQEETVAQKMGLNNQNQNKVKWNQKGLQTGKFTEEELLKLQHSVCKYAQEQQMNEEQLLQFISVPKTKFSFGAWSHIAQVLPHRSVQSCHNLIKRKFNPFNYKGRWTEQEVEELLNAVETHGRKWELISKELGRTAINCRDKYKSLGEVNYLQREQMWSLEEMIKVMKYVEKKVKIRFINRIKMEAYFQIHPQELHDKIDIGSEDASRKRRSKNSLPDKSYTILSNFIDYQKIKDEKFENINWTKIAEKLKTKSYDDCRNKWKNQLQACLMRDMGYSDDQDQQLVEQIMQQYPEQESEIDFSAIDNGKSTQQNKIRWRILKKRVGFENIGNQEFESQLKELKSQFRKMYNKKRQNQDKLEDNNSDRQSENKQNQLLLMFTNEYGDNNDNEIEEKKVQKKRKLSSNKSKSK